MVLGTTITRISGKWNQPSEFYAIYFLHESFDPFENFVNYWWIHEEICQSIMSKIMKIQVANQLENINFPIIKSSSFKLFMTFYLSVKIWFSSCHSNKLTRKHLHEWNIFLNSTFLIDSVYHLNFLFSTLVSMWNWNLNFPMKRWQILDLIFIWIAWTSFEIKRWRRRLLFVITLFSSYFVLFDGQGHGKI